MSPEPRRPGQSNADYDNDQGRSDALQAKFQGTNSVQGGGDPSWVQGLWRAIFAWPEKRRAKRSAKQRKTDG